jgi:hypothetical protein
LCVVCVPAVEDEGFSGFERGLGFFGRGEVLERFVVLEERVRFLRFFDVCLVEETGNNSLPPIGFNVPRIFGSKYVGVAALSVGLAFLYV